MTLDRRATPSDSVELNRFARDLGNRRLVRYVLDVAESAAREAFTKTYYDLLRVAKQREDQEVGPDGSIFEVKE